jgi:uncharacterized DUF497 family protein
VRIYPHEFGGSGRAVSCSNPLILGTKCSLHFFVYIHNIQIMVNLSKITGFEWDDGNARKNEKHGVSMAEAEQVFFNNPLLLLEDPKHSQAEVRLHALGKTDEERLLHITFTLRQAGEKIRVISARDMHKKERATYEH